MSLNSNDPDIRLMRLRFTEKHRNPELNENLKCSIKTKGAFQIENLNPNFLHEFSFLFPF